MSWGDYIELEEYNWYDDHIYHRQVVNKNTVTGFIHFKDINRVVDDSSNQPSPSVDQEVPESGVYYFKGRASIKSEPKMSSPELAYYDAGQSVNYDRKLIADGHEWISYLSYAGNRRYIPIREIVNVTSSPTGTIRIVNNDSETGTFDIIVSNVSDVNGVQKVSLPTWSEIDGQDDIIWYTATRQSDGTYRQHVNVSDHKNSTGVYNVHLYYVENSGKLVGVGGTTYTVPAKVEETHTTTSYSLPDAGTYTFKERTGIKAEPRVASPELAYYDAGMSVNYDKVVNNDGYTWLSYLSYSGHRFYVAIAPTSVTKPVEQPVQPSTPSSGTYTFKERSSIKAEPSVASPELAYYDTGMSVNYDRLVTADGHTWLSYVSHGGNRRYIAIDGKATAVAQPASPSLAATGTYTFTKPSSIKAQPSVASPELAYYDKGMSVRYDKVLTADGHTWLSYVTYSGARRYVDIA